MFMQYPLQEFMYSLYVCLSLVKYSCNFNCAVCGRGIEIRMCRNLSWNLSSTFKKFVVYSYSDMSLLTEANIVQIQTNNLTLILLSYRNTAPLTQFQNYGVPNKRQVKKSRELTSEFMYRILQINHKTRRRMNVLP